MNIKYRISGDLIYLTIEQYGIETYTLKNDLNDIIQAITEAFIGFRILNNIQ